MRWRKRRRSANVEDRRGQSAGGGFGRGGFRIPGGLGGRRGGGLRIPGGRKGGLGGLGLVAVVLIALFLGVDPGMILQGGGGALVPQQAPTGGAAPRSAAEDELAEFVSVVLADTETTWHEIFRRLGSRYQEPKLVLFTGAVQSSCGFAQAAMGPFYCPGDQKVYIDLGFFHDLKQRHQAPGDFAQAYVVAHEVGHHVQNLLGILPKVHEARSRLGKAEANALSVRLELQADCLAGVWGNHAGRLRDLLEKGDVEEGLRAASAIGDDRLQSQAQGYVVPESFTHGSSEQRVRWFRLGLKSGDPAACDSFNSDRL